MCIDGLLKVVIIGPDWPNSGEIDIVEGVNDFTNNQATIHTDVGCTLPSSNSATLGISGNVIGGTNCAAYTTDNQGCGIRANSSNSFGVGFNNNKGGVYASMLAKYLTCLFLTSLHLVKWDTSGVAVYFFPRGSVPADISANAPQPNSWGRPLARWAASSCPPFKFFYGHSAIFDVTTWCAVLSDQSDASILSFFIVAIGREESGITPVSQVKNKAARREQVFRHVKLLYKPGGLRWPKHVGGSLFPL